MGDHKVKLDFWVVVAVVYAVASVGGFAAFVKSQDSSASQAQCLVYGLGLFLMAPVLMVVGAFWVGKKK